MQPEEQKSSESLQMVQSEVPAEAGISSVAGSGSQKFLNRKNLYMLLAAIVALIAIVTWIRPDHSTARSKNRTQEERNFVTSTRVLTLPPLPAENKAPELPVEDHEVKDNPLEKIIPFGTGEAKPEAPASSQSLSMQEALQTLPLVANAPKHEEKSEPTLEERRFSAPMMGEAEKSPSPSGNKDVAFNETPPSSGGKLGSMLVSVSTPPTAAEKMPDRNMLLPKGSFIDCVLETRVDTTVPGMTSCVIPRNIYSANGKVLLVERGSKAIGEYKGSVENGLNRIFVLWTQVQTPKGVRVNLDSPTSDALGGAGMAGDIDFHWWRRFGNALMFSLIQDGFEYGMSLNSENNGGVNYYQNSEDGMKEIIREAMRQSGNIPPTLTRNQGERIGIFVARDLDFSGVYQLKPVYEGGKNG